MGGRHDIVSLLISSGAPTDRKNHAGQTAADISSDPRCRELLFLQAVEANEVPGNLPLVQGQAAISAETMWSESVWHELEDVVTEQRADDAVSDEVGLEPQRMRYEPFFVPRDPVITEQRQDPVKVRMALGETIFNCQPGAGLAFLVASGCIRDYPLEIVSFLRRSAADLTQISNFLGEAFSFAKILRMEFINSINLVGTGVVTALIKSFANFSVPSDLRKMDRIINSLAEVWWRQHEQPGLRIPDSNKRFEEGRLDELKGHELRKAVQSPEVLYQVMFSAMMLHCNQHALLSDSHLLDCNAWLELNQGICEACGRELTEEILEPIYGLLTSREVPHLSFKTITNKSIRPERSALSAHAQVEGWVRILGSTFLVPPVLFGLNGNQKEPYMGGVPHMYSEASASARRGQIRQPAVLQTMWEEIGQTSTDEGIAVREMPPDGSTDALWMSICGCLLFLSTRPSPDGAPFAFLPLSVMHLREVNESQSQFTIVGSSSGATDADPSVGPHSLELVYLLPDSRWQSFKVPQLTIKACEPPQMQAWVARLTFLSARRL